jgi:hypothetical protein
MIEQQVNDTKDKIENVKVRSILADHQLFILFCRKFFKKKMFHIQPSMQPINHVMLKIV